MLASRPAPSLRTIQAMILITGLLAAMSEWPIWRLVPAGTGRSAVSRYLAVWLVTVQLSPAASAGKQPETANFITQTDRRSGAGMFVLATRPARGVGFRPSAARNKA
jgi:hypothetical protein